MKLAAATLLCASLGLAAPAAHADDLVCHSTTINAVATADTPVLTTMQCERPTHVLPALRWTSLAAATAALTAGITFEVLAANDRATLQYYANQRDANTGLPLVRYADTAALDQRRAQDEALGTAFLIAGGVLGITNLVLWLLPDHGPVGHAAARVRERTAIGISPNSLVLRVAF